MLSDYEMVLEVFRNLIIHEYILTRKWLVDSKPTSTDSDLGEAASPFHRSSGIRNVYDTVGDP